MTFKHYVELCNQILEYNPEYGDFPAVYASDDEGNSYHQAIFAPTPLVVDDPESNMPEIVNPEGKKFNAICIN